VYLDEIFIIGNDTVRIYQLKEHLCNHFRIKDLGSLKYFLGIKVAKSKEGVVISQRKYALNILKETGMFYGKPMDCPMDPKLSLIQKDIKD